MKYRATCGIRLELSKCFIYKQKLKYTVTDTVTDQHRPKSDCVDGAVAVSFS